MSRFLTTDVVTVDSEVNIALPLDLMIKYQNQ